MPKPSLDARNKFSIARAEALLGYTYIERALSLLFASILGTRARYATLIISKILNTRARNELVQKIADDVTQKKFRTFTNSLFREISDLDGKRNMLVHWLIEVREDGVSVLRHPDPFGGSNVEMTERQLWELASKASFLVSVINMFREYITKPEKGDALRNIFLQPLSCPPEPHHPLYQMRRDNGLPLWPSQK